MCMKNALTFAEGIVRCPHVCVVAFVDEGVVMWYCGFVRHCCVACVVILVINHSSNQVCQVINRSGNR